MSFQEQWRLALQQTAIIRGRVQRLKTFADTDMPYILLSSSSVNVGDTVVRKGHVQVRRPALILPPDHPQFSGFDWKDQDLVADNVLNFLLVRGISLPSFNYDNQTVSLDVFNGDLERGIAYYHDQLQKTENVQTGLITGPEDGWPFSLLIYICTQIARNAETDIRDLLEKYRDKGR